MPSRLSLRQVGPLRISMDARTGEVNRRRSAEFERRGGGLNPRTSCPVSGFQDRPLRPLRHPAAAPVVPLESTCVRSTYFVRTPTAGGNVKRSLLALVGTAAAAALVLPALGIGGGDGRKVLDAKVLAPVTAPYTGAANPIRGLNGGGLPWKIGDAQADLRADGRLHVEVEGLVLASTGANPVAQFKAVVSCQTTANGLATVANVSTPLVDASPTGDAEISTTIALPSPCFAPIVFVTSPGSSWFAVTGR